MDDPEPVCFFEDVANLCGDVDRLCEREVALARERDSLPDEVRGRVRGGISSTTGLIPVIARTRSRISSGPLAVPETTISRYSPANS